MDAFLTHERVISSYKRYLESFISIKDERIQEYVSKATMTQDLLPEPLIQFNPSYAKGVDFEALKEKGVIHKDLPKIVGIYPPFKHQVEAITLGVRDKGFVVTSGTGSGKSLTYISTIFNDILKRGQSKQKGVKAILVYPMNALINSQEDEIKKYKDYYENKTGKDFPITFAQYTGQQHGSERDIIKREEPDIILTNYMMLELIMTRRAESWLRDSIKNHLKYLVYDELHTYRGRQGSDVSMLNRRIEALSKQELILIGTSATMASKGTPEEKKKEVAKVASIIFGKKYDTSQIINEYLEPCTQGLIPSRQELIEAIKQGIDQTQEADAFVRNPLANWIEKNIALRENTGILERGIPMSLLKISERLTEETNLPSDTIIPVLKDLLRWAEQINKKNREKGVYKSYLPFRFHQFISQTGSIAVTLDSRKERHIDSSVERYIKINGEDRPLFPVLFSRYTGYDFLKVELNTEENLLMPAYANDEFFNPKEKEVDTKNLTQDDFKYGYIVLDEGESFWKEDFRDFVPESWWKHNGQRLNEYKEYLLPRPIRFNRDGRFSFDLNAQLELKGFFMPTPLRIDPTALIFYDDARTKDSTKLSRLGSEGRSTATSVLSYSIVNSLIEQKEKYEDQKLLSFTDNRQDASLQAGHFNDFYTTIRFRSALYNAIESENNSVEIHQLPERIFESLNLKEVSYARYPSEDPDFPEEKNLRAIKLMITYQALQDLKRGWRYTMPNLEQVGLLNIEYRNLRKLASLPQKFQGIALFDDLNESELYEVLENILDYFRTNYAFDHQFFDKRSENENIIKQFLSEDGPWALGADDKLESPRLLYVKTVRGRSRGMYLTSIGNRSNLGKYLNELRSRKGYESLRKEEYEEWLESVLNVLKRANLLVTETFKRFPDHQFYKLRVDAILWTKNKTGEVKPDITRLNYYDSDLKIQINQFFKELYEKDLSNAPKELLASEHTGQIKSEDRIEREKQFIEGEISTLYCSPTMELGIDISNLNIVHLRNVPPNAANYAQRSGRAGRSGQTALVFTYCSNTSPHDVHYFEHSEEMVAGVVQPPRIDLVNEELILSHLNAFLLMHLQIGELKTAAAEILDLSDESNVKIKENILENLKSQILNFGKEYAREFDGVIKSLFPLLEKASWYREEWVQHQVNQFPANFVNVFNRWIHMFENACKIRNKAQAVLDDHTYTTDSQERKEAERQERFARKQIDTLKNDSQKYNSNSEFYIFRYLAAEGFLPGYNFTRLPVRAVLGKSYKGDVEVISRPRQLALNEFGPNNIVYHSGNKYKMNRMMITDVDNSKEKILISTETGYAFLNEESKKANVDPITGGPLKNDKSLVYANLLELSECEGIPMQKITSIEEERSRLGYEIQSFFNYPQGVENAESVVLKKDGEKLLQLYFNSATQLINVNSKPKRALEDGFKINPENGVWVRAKDLDDNEELAQKVKEVFLYTKDTADTLYIQPLGNIGTTAEEVISLSYALKRGIERRFQVEENEIGVEVMGNPEKPNVLIYEAAEGSLGILSQLIKNPTVMKEWFEDSYRAIHFDPTTFEESEEGKSLPKASYKDLLSYFNQRHHKVIDRYSIKETLEFLIGCDVETVQGGGNDREEQYKYLLENYDKNSSTELKFLKYLYHNDYALPDIAQQNLKDYYISADFIYKNHGHPTIIFCDGSVHDKSNIREDDQNKRQILEDAGFDVIVWHYAEPLEELVKRRKDIFRKVN